MPLSARAEVYLESLWGEALRKINSRRDLELDRVRQGLNDPVDIYRGRVGFWTFVQPEIDHIADTGKARTECLLKAYVWDEKMLSDAVIEEMLRDIAQSMENAAVALLVRKQDEISLVKSRIPKDSSTPDVADLTIRVLAVRKDTEEQLRRELIIRMCETEQRPATYPTTGSGVTANQDHRFARLAIEEARKSISEPDGRHHPKVGAVVVQSGVVLVTATALQHRKQRRESFLRMFYDVVDGKEGTGISQPQWWGIGSHLGIPQAEIDDILRYWIGEQLIALKAAPDWYALTHKGVVFAERLQEQDNTSMHHAMQSTGLGCNPDVPTAFMSYSWDTPAHKAWVLRLAERLRTEGGVNVILDHWHLPVGGDRTYFMENSIHESDFVLLLCTPAYARRSNARSGGVGYEATILTGQLAQHITQNKFIPVLRVGEWDDSSVPIWLQTKIGVDLRDEPYSEDQYQLLLRTLHQAQEVAPPIGPKPSFQAPTYIEAHGLLGNAVTPVLGAEAARPDPARSQLNATISTRPKQSPEAYAFYEKKGTDARVQAFVRPVDSSADVYTFETSTGCYEEGSRREIELRYLSCDLDLKKDGYTRMQSFNGTSGQRFNLP